jgi:hypothetical protein
MSSGQQHFQHLLGYTNASLRPWRQRTAYPLAPAPQPSRLASSVIVAAKPADAAAAPRAPVLHTPDDPS